MAKRALILFPPGAEETAPVIVFSVLTMGKVDAKICSLCGKDPIRGAQGVRILPDIDLKEARECGPLALLAHEVLFGKSLTGYPTAKTELATKYTYKECPVIIDETLVTSKGPGTAFLFAKTLLELLTDKKTACEVAQAMLIEEK
ncbi:unnamed protein product [Phyllotreta striolata]|uniref:DJ-1/PfpI domain-containing protein n=1 Tax=Phyllotreta striolata TaxID=444603 RepID=A0A9N9TEZ3_PHYSR|nr:unnamed protein product [Phyllotreta striolata]